MEIAENVFYEEGTMILKGIKNESLADILRKEGIDADIGDEGLVIHVDSIEKALEIYRKVIRALLHTEYLKKLGFSFREIFGYGFLIYLREYREGLENEILNHPLKQDFDIVTLPNKEGYYYSTLYGIDNLYVSAILTLGNLFARELMEIVESNPSLTELLELKRISENVLRLERLGDAKLAKLARSLERVERMEEIIKKMLAVRFAFSCEMAIAGNVEHVEVQKIRKLGNGLCVYLNKNLRRILDIEEGCVVTVMVLGGKIFIEKSSLACRCP